MERNIIVAVDAMGGDNAPFEIVKGVVEAVKLYPSVQKMLDKLAKTNIIHKNKAANLKSSLCLHISKLG